MAQSATDVIKRYPDDAIAVAAAGDSETETLARSIQQQERQTADKVWALIPRASREAFARVATA